MSFPKGFMIGAATAAHQVEGNNKNSDYWLQEQMPHSSFTEPSGIACDHYNRYKEDIKMLADAGLNAYRFSVEWARIEPQEGVFRRVCGHGFLPGLLLSFSCPARHSERSHFSVIPSEARNLREAVHPDARFAEILRASPSG